MLNISETLTQQRVGSRSFNNNNIVSPKIEGGNGQNFNFSPLTGESDSSLKGMILRELESAKFSVRHFDKMPKSIALKAFQRL